MANLTNAQKKEWAKTLYLKENLTQAEIAEKVDCSRQTINKWIKAEKWEEQRTGITLTREEQIVNMYRQVAEINSLIGNRPQGERFASNSEVYILNQLASAIKKLESDVGIADIISVTRRFLSWLRPVDMEQTKITTRLMDAFIKDNL